MVRVRFRINNLEVDGDYRPIKWPIKYPYWCTGESIPHAADCDDFYYTIVAYLDNEKDIYDLWPEAYHIERQDADKIIFTDRFPKPDWYNI